MNLLKIEKTISNLLKELGINDSEVLSNTPRRVAHMYEQFLSGYNVDPSSVLQKTFPVSSNDIVLVKDIFFSSLCEHHLLPFFGRVNIAYIPNGRVVGLSKLGRLVDIISNRLQLQERMTIQIGEALLKNLSPQGVIVTCKAQHACMICRGVKKNDSTTVSFFKLGDISENQVKMMLDV